MNSATWRKFKIEAKEIQWYTWMYLVLSIILITYFIFGENLKLKLILGGFFLIFHAFSIRKQNLLAFIFEVITGGMALLTLLLPQYPLWYTLIIYSLFTLTIFGFLYLHRKMRFQEIKNNFYQWSSILFVLIFGVIIIVTMKSVISFGFQKPLNAIDYILIIQLSVISIITFFLLFDNIIRVIPLNIRKNLIGEYSSAHAVFLSLCVTILIGGYFYINASENEVLQKILVVLGVAFFTSLSIAESLKSLFN